MLGFRHPIVALSAGTAIRIVSTVLEGIGLRLLAVHGFRIVPFALPVSVENFHAKPRGVNAVRNSCRACGSLAFGGQAGNAKLFPIYAGTLDDPSLFHPAVAIFTRNRPVRAAMAADLTTYEEGF